MYTVEPLIKDTLNKGHLCIKGTFQCIVVIHFTSERGKPLYNGQNDLSLPLYMHRPLRHLYCTKATRMRKYFSDENELPQVGLKPTALCSLDECSNTELPNWLG